MKAIIISSVYLRCRGMKRLIFCRSINGDLVAINDQDEDDYLQAFFTLIITGQDTTALKAVIFHGPMALHSAMNNGIVVIPKSADCTSGSSLGLWNDNLCSDSNYYICEDSLRTRPWRTATGTD